MNPARQVTRLGSLGPKADRRPRLFPTGPLRFPERSAPPARARPGLLSVGSDSWRRAPLQNSSAGPLVRAGELVGGGTFAPPDRFTSPGGPNRWERGARAPTGSFGEKTFGTWGVAPPGSGHFLRPRPNSPASGPPPSPPPSRNCRGGYHPDFRASQHLAIPISGPWQHPPHLSPPEMRVSRPLRGRPRFPRELLFLRGGAPGPGGTRYPCVFFAARRTTAVGGLTSPTGEPGPGAAIGQGFGPCPSAQHGPPPLQTPGGSWGVRSPGGGETFARGEKLRAALTSRPGPPLAELGSRRPAPPQGGGRDIRAGLGAYPGGNGAPGNRGPVARSDHPPDKRWVDGAFS
jgi:hypothetical protein